MIAPAPDAASRSERVARRFEKPVIVAAVLVIPALIVEANADSDNVRLGAVVLNWVIWLVFVAEIVAMLAVVPDRRRWLRSNPLTIAIAVLTVPFLPASLQAARVLRLARLVRLVLVVRLAQRLIAPTALPFAAATVGFGILSGAAAFQAAERTARSPPDLWDSVWWAITTITTVGYGDVYPTTTLGRIVGIVLMLLGIGFVALLTATIAQRFLQVDAERIEASEARIEIEEREIADEFRELAERLARLEERVSRQR